MLASLDLKDTAATSSEANSPAEQTPANHLMEQYFSLVNTHMHGQPGGIVESESFTPEFVLPSCYDVPTFRDPAAAGAEPKQVIPPARC